MACILALRQAGDGLAQPPDHVEPVGEIQLLRAPEKNEGAFTLALSGANKVCKLLNQAVVGGIVACNWPGNFDKFHQAIGIKFAKPSRLVQNSRKPAPDCWKPFAIA